MPQFVPDAPTFVADEEPPVEQLTRDEYVQALKDLEEQRRSDFTPAPVTPTAARGYVDYLQVRPGEEAGLPNGFRFIQEFNGQPRVVEMTPNGPAIAIGENPIEDQVSAEGAFLRSAGREFPSATAGVVAGGRVAQGVSQATQGLRASPLAPVRAAGAILPPLAGLIAGAGTALGARFVQDEAVANLAPDDVAQAYINSQIRDLRQQPTASLAGALAAQLPTAGVGFNPGLSFGERAASSAVGAGVGGGLQALQETQTDQEGAGGRIALAALGGAALQRDTKLTQSLTPKPNMAAQATTAAKNLKQADGAGAQQVLNQISEPRAAAGLAEIPQPTNELSPIDIALGRRVPEGPLTDVPTTPQSRDALAADLALAEIEDAPRQNFLRNILEEEGVEAPAGSTPVDVAIASGNEAPPAKVESTPARVVPGDEDFLFTVQRDQGSGDDLIPGYIQVYDVTGGANRESGNLEKFRARGIDLPDVPENLPQGQYSPGQIKAAAVKKAPRVAGRGNQAGFAPSRVIANLAAPVVGGAIGGQFGDTPEERFKNMLLGAGLASAATGLATAPRRLSVKERYRQQATGREGLPDWYIKFRKTPAMVAIREAYANNRTRVKDMVATADVSRNVPEDANPYQEGRLYPGVIKPRLENADNLATGFERQILEVANAGAIDPNEFRGKYQSYLAAKHAPDYNKNVIRDDGKPASGATDEEWAAVQQTLRDQGLYGVFEDLEKSHRPIINLILDTLVEGQVIDEGMRKMLREKYPNYIPFNRSMGDEETGLDIVSQLLGVQEEIKPGVGGPSGARVTSTGIRRAKGSDLAIDDVFGNTLANLKDAVIRAEKNKVALATLRFAEERGKEFGATVRKLEPGEAMRQDKIVVARRNGQPYVVDFGDKLMNEAAWTLGGTTPGPIIRFIGQLTRYWSGLNTRFSPTFLAANPVRDKVEAATVMLSQGDFQGAVNQLNPARAFEDMRAVVDHYRGKETPGRALYDEMVKNGGAIGGYGFSTRDDALKTINEIRKSVTSTPTKAKEGFLKFVDFLNEISEGSTRLRSYKAALDAGATVKEAALASRSNSVDFNVAGRLSPAAKSLFAFIQPAITGTTGVAKAALRSPRTVGALATGLLGIGVTLDQWNKSIDPNWKERPELKLLRQRGIPMLYGINEDGTAQVFTIPLAHGLRPLKSMIDFTIDLNAGDVKDPKQALEAVAETAATALNPLGSNDPITALVPTLARPAIQVDRNRREGDIPIVPQSKASNPNIPDTLKRSTNFTRTPEGKLYAGVTDWLYKSEMADVSPQNLKFILDSYLGGPWRTVRKAYNTSAARDADGISPSEVPIIDAFFSEASGEIRKADSVEQRETLEQLKRSNFEIGLVRESAKRLVADMRESVGGTENWGAYLQQAAKDGLIPDNPLYRRALVGELKSAAKELDDVDYLIGQFGVTDGARARYYVERRSEMQPEQWHMFVQEQAKKKLLTREVARQIGIISQQK